MDKNEALAWLTWLYGETFEGKVWIGGHADGFKGQRFSDLAAAVDYAAALDAAGGMGVYHRLTTMSVASPGRGAATDSIMLPALMMDLDLRGPGHVSDLYPASRDDIEKILSVAGVPAPTTWVESGGGLYAVWKLDRPEPVHESGEVLLAAQEASRALHRSVIAAAKSLGFKIDNTSDLARIFRLPGTHNRKPGMPAGLRASWGGAAGVLHPLAGFVARTPSPQPADNASAFSDASMWGGGMAALFGQSSAGGGSGARGFTVEQAMAFVRPALDALATAADGEINVRLNEAACQLAHFGPEFWDEAAADRQLESALACTMYDGLTWKAEDTIASARRAMSGDWRAVRVEPPVTAAAAAEVIAAGAPVDAVEALLAEMLEPGEVISRPPPRFLVHGVLQFDSESWLIGPPGSKKSFVVLDIAARVARGEAWQGRRTHPADVVMVVAEGAGGVGKRLKAWEKRYGAFPAGSMRILPRPVQAMNPNAWVVLVEACRRLADAARERGRGLMVILDTQARVTVGLKENDATDMGIFVGALSAIREATEGCVLTVHHTGRAGGDARGSSAIDGAQTTELKVMADKGRLTGRLTVEKQKDIEEIEPIRLAFESIDVGQDEEGQAITSLVLCEAGSASFQAAWSEAEVTEEGVTTEEQMKVHTLTARVVVDHWIRERTRSLPTQWAIQVLLDSGRERGFTKAETWGQVEEKIGKKIARTTFNGVWTAITDSMGEWQGLVVPGSTADRFTVDPIAASEAARAKPDKVG